MRRVHVPQLLPGAFTLDPPKAHHLLQVLRLRDGEAVEVFDDTGQIAVGILRRLGRKVARVELGPITPAPSSTGVEIIVASAVPRSNRSDWMIEKLTELGTSEFVPLVSARSLVAPVGRSKIARWQRISAEAARQSRRNGVMAIAALMPLEDLAIHLDPIDRVWHLSPEVDAMPMLQALGEADGWKRCALVVGPEGGWTPAEQEWFAERNIPALRLGSAVLRVETACVVAAALAAAAADARKPD